MKKIDKLRVTLLGFLVCLMSMSLMAQRVTMDFTTNGWGLPSDYTNTEATYTNGTYQLTFHPGTVGDGLKFNSNYLIFGKTNASLSLPAFDFNVERIEIVGKSGASTAVKQNIFVNETAVSTETTGAVETNVYEIADAYQAAGNVYTIKVSSKHNTQITYIKVYEASAPAAVAAPTFTPAAGNYFAAQNVTLASATEGAIIYYTVDGTIPTIESLLYQGPIAVSENTTIKAIAILGEEESSVATANYNIPVELATIEAFKAAELDNNTIYKITGDVKVLGQYDNKKSTFIQDKDGYAALYIFDQNGSKVNTYNPGDVISGGVYGKYAPYNDLRELVPVEGFPFAEGTPGEPIAPDVRTLDNVLAYYDWFEGKLVTIKGLTFTESRTFGTTTATKGAIATQGENTIKVYNTLGTITGVEVSEGMTADVTGYIIRYGEDIEIAPRGSEDIVEVVGPAVAPWTATFEDATENSAWEINNGTYSNKWFIGQAQGFDNNKLYISSNNGVTNKYVAEYSFVKASRAIVIPQNGAVLSFDYRVNGNNNDYMQVSIVKGGVSTTLERLSGANEWTNATYTISPDMAGEATLVFLWTNQAGNANQFPAAIDNVSLMESSCSQPTALQAPVEGTTATISWTGDAEAYLLQYKLADHSEWYSVNTTENTVVLNNLQGNSNYNVRVQSVCGEDASAWAEGNFVVDCQNLIIDEEEVTFGNGTSTNNYQFPLSAYYYHSYTQQLFTEEELAAMGITAGSQMSAISFNYFWGTATTRPITIWLGTTTMTSLSSAFVPKDENFVQVYSNNCQEFSNSNENWVKLSFDQSFTYNGGSLVVAVLSNKEDATTACFTQYNGTYRFYLNDQQGKARYYSVDGATSITFNASGMPQTTSQQSGSVSYYRNNIKFDATVLTCGDVEACPAVTNVNVDNVTPNSAELTWAAGSEDETLFNVEYYAEGSSMIQSVQVEGTSYTLSGLSQLTKYTVKVQALCGENNTSEPVEIEFATSGICPPVSDIQSSNAANTTTLTWTPDGEETAWLVQFKPAAAGDNEWISINVNSLPTTTFGGLMATTLYDVRVKALCDPADEENQSEWANHEFTSGCAAFDIPFAETFDSYNMPTCWDADGFGFSGGYAYSYDLDAWIMTPAINIPSDETTYLAFDVKGYGNFSVMASYRGTDASRFAEIYSGEIESGSNYTQVVVPMADNLKGRQVYFKIVNNADQYQYIDNLSVDYCPFVPANLTVSNITENSAVLAWTADEAVSNFQVKVGENIIDVEGAKTYTLTGLDASTSYTFSVRTQCGEDSYGKWSAEAEFTTACPSVTLPYTEDFESTETYEFPACWTIVSSAMYNPPYVYSYSSYSQFTTNFLGLNYAAVVATPKIAAPANQLMLNFDFTQESTTYCGPIEVGFTTDLSSVENITWLQTINNSMNKAVEHKTVYFNTLNTDAEGYIVFRGQSSNYLLAIDNVLVETIPTCGTPSIAVNGTTATITRSSIGTPASYDLQIGNQIETVPATQTTVDLASIFTLELNTNYEVSVRANCGTEDQSEWSQPVSFTTPVCLDARTVAIGDGTNGFTYLPTYSLYNYSITEQIYTAAEIGSAGNITSITFNSVGDTRERTLDIYMVHTNQTTFSSTTAWVHPTNDDKVFTGSVSFGAGQLVKIPFDKPFEYDGNQNVVLIVNDRTGSYLSGLSCAVTNYPGNVSLYKYQDASAYNPMTISITGTLATQRNNVQFEICPAPVVTCPRPSNLVPNEVTATSANLTWTAGDVETQWEVEYGVEGFVHGEGTSVIVNENTLNLVGLASATTYNVYVRAICAEGDYSEWSQAVSFMTPCALTDLPYVEDFESYSGTTYNSNGIVPNCWDKYATGSIAPHIIGSGSYYYPHSGSKALTFYGNGSCYAVMPEFSQSISNLQISFWMRTESSSYGTLSLGYITSEDDNMNTFTQIQSFASTGTTPEYREVDLTNVPANAYKLVFKWYYSGQWSCCVDDISVKQAHFEKDLAINSIDPIAWACDQSDAKVTINVENAGITDTITSFEARYVINTQAPVSETVNCNLAPGETMSYTFNTTPVFEDGENTVLAIVDMEGDMQVENNYTDPIIVSLLEPETVPYTPTLSADLVNKGWNVVDANNDGITMDINAKAIVYTFNDTLAANDWMFTPCIEMPAGTYNVYYDYRANSSLNEKFEVFYGAGANVAAMTNEVANHDFNNTDYETVMQTITVAEDGIYNFGFHAMSLAGNLGFNIANFKVYPVVDVTVTSGENGTVTPNGVVSVNYGENLNLAIVPNTMYHVAGVWVDDVQVMSEDPYNSNFMIYTLENVTEPHNVFVDYKLEYHIIKSVANYNPAYTDVPGEFIPAATDTLIDPDPVTVNFAAAPHYHLYSLEMAMMNEEDMVDVTADVVDNGDHTYSYTTEELVVANYYLKATFRRDTVAVNYLVNTGKGYADASDVLAQGAQYATWWDYSVDNDVDAVANIRPYTTGDAHSDYHIVNVNVNGEDMGVIDTYTFENIQEDQNIAIDFGYEITTSIRNYVPTYLESDDVRGTIQPATQLVAEGKPTIVSGTVQEHFHLYNLFVDGVDMIDQVEFDEDNNYSLTIDSTIANYHIEAVVKIDTFGIHYDVMDGQGYADASDLLVAPADYITWVNYGDDFMMNLSPDRGFSIGSVIVDGENMYTANNYLFEYVEEHHYVAVSFVPNDYTITTNAYGHGTVTDGMSFTYDPESPVNYQFIATAEEGYHISAIVINDAEIDLTGITDTYTQTLENVAANYVINAIFEINTYNMVSEASLGGTITPEGLQVVNHGTDLTYEIVADEGRYISSITIDGITVEYTQADNITNLPQQFTSINADHSISVTFAVKHFTITAEVNEEANHGTIDGVSSFSGEFSYGSNQTLNFIPEENYQVSDVVVDGQSVGAVASYEFVNITAEHNVVVSFAPVQYTLTATSNVPACTITPATTTVQAGSNVNYTLTVATGYHLLNVIANGEEVSVSGNAFTIANVQEDYEIFANFAPNYVTVTVEQPAHATITPGTMTYAYGATPSYVIVPEVGYNVTAVHAGNALVNVTYNNGIGSFTLNPVTADVTVSATTAIKTFTITATQAAHGTISPVAVQTVNYGGNVTYTITPDDYYEIVDVLVDGSSRGALSTYTFNNVTANHTIEAVFEAACMTPSRLTVVYVDTNSATLTWEGNANSYEVRYRAAGETNFTTQTVTTNTITLTGLTENTLYAWGVKANCTASMSSDWAESAFRTNAVIPPYVGISTADLSSIKVYSHLNNVYIVNENGIAIENVTIYNIFGAQVYTGKANNNPEIISLDVANGNYIVRLSTENGVGVYKLSIVR